VDQVQTRTQGSHKGVEPVQEQWEQRLRCSRGRKGVEDGGEQGK
jgi:hypothetical protein